jgi:AcrR family transcriptional regulator
MNLHSRRPARRAPRAAGAPLKDEARDLFRNGILAAAETVFAERGYHAARIQDIARAARIAVGTVYNHFDDKDALLAALLDERTAEMLDCLGPQGDEPADFGGRLEGRIARLLAHAEKRRGTWTILVAHGLTGGAGGEPARVRRRGDRLNAAWRSLIEDGQRAGALAPLPPAPLAAFLAGVVRSMVATSVLGGEGLAGKAPLAVRLFLRGASA